MKKKERKHIYSRDLDLDIFKFKKLPQKEHISKPNHKPKYLHGEDLAIIQKNQNT